MKYLVLPTTSAIAAAALFSAAAFAQSSLETRLIFDTDNLDRYDDAPFDDRETDLAVSVLTDEGVLRGNDPSPGSGQARTFAPDRRLNRAEFVQIVIRLLDDTGTVNTNCFPDVSPSVWYADPVCRAKAIGLVRGNAQVGVSEDLWRFEPTRDVQYEEAIKILVHVYALPVNGETDGDDWYVPYIRAAADLELTIDGLAPGDRITRAEMARLTLAFVAHAHGQLDEYRDAERGENASSRSSSSSSRSNSSSSRMSGSSRSSSASSFSRDPDANLTVRSNFLLLGEVGPVVGAVDFFAQSEPIGAERITVRFASDPSSIQQVRVYAEEDGRLLGTSFRDGSGDYAIDLPTGALTLPHREEIGVYVRVLLKPADGGGAGGEIVRIEDIEIEGDGQWSNSDYTVTSTETFLQFETAPAALIGFASATSLSSSVFVPGSAITLWDYNISARSTDNDFEAALTSLTFRVAKSSDVSLSGVTLSMPDSGASVDCTVTSSTIVCEDIPESVGTIDDLQRLRLRADVALDAGAVDPFLHVTLQEAGNPSSSGDIEWTDGSTDYDWVALEEPVAQGIRFD